MSLDWFNALWGAFGVIIAGWAAYVSYQNNKKSSKNSNDEFSVEKIKEVADRQIDVHREEVNQVKEKLNDILDQLKTSKVELKANQAEMDELHQKYKRLQTYSTNIRAGYEKKIKNLEQENKQLRSRCNYLQNKINGMKDKE